MELRPALDLLDGKRRVDCNLSYRPSCSYQPSRVCPLAPAANTLDVSLRAGEWTRP